MTAHSHLAHDLPRASRRNRKWALLAVAAGLVLTAWMIAQYPPILQSSSIDEVSVTYNLSVAGAIPWFLQWAGLICVVVSFYGSQKTREAVLFAILASFSLAALWWLGVAFRFRGMDTFDAIVDVIVVEIALGFGGGSTFDKYFFLVLGPMLGPLNLRGPLSLRGWDFLLSMLSTALVVGYLLIVGRFWSTARRSNSTSDCLKFMGALLLCFTPPFLGMVIRIAYTA